MSDSFSRRNFLGLSAGVAAAIGGSALLGGCAGTGETGGAVAPTTSGGANAGDVPNIKFWDQPWGSEEYTNAAKELVASYQPAPGLAAVDYTQVTWDNFYQTYSTAVATKTNPHFSTGGGFQPFGLAEMGGILYADNVAAKLKDDYVEGLIDYVTMPEGVAGLPWQLDFCVLYHTKSVLDQYGLQPPKNWNDLITIGDALKKDGKVSFIVGGGAGNDRAHQTLTSLMLNNGGGLFDENGKLDVLYDRNVEAVQFFIDMVKAGYIAKEAINYSQDNMAKQWADRNGCVGFQPPNYAYTIGGDMIGDMLVNSPLEGPHGDKGGLRFVNSLMMYKNNSDIPSTEAFLLWWLQNIKIFWEKKVVQGVPTLKSIRESEAFSSNTELVKIADEWGPVAKHTGSRAASAFPDLAKIDGSAVFYTFAQMAMEGKSDAKECLSWFDNELKGILS